MFINAPIPNIWKDSDGRSVIKIPFANARSVAPHIELHQIGPRKFVMIKGHLSLIAFQQSIRYR